MRWAVSDFRRNAGVWTGTFLTLFVAVAACVATVLSRNSAETLLAAAWSRRSADVIEPGCDLAWKASLVFVFFTIPPVLRAGISQRRRDLALLSLQGASPAEMLARTELQMLVLLVPACVLGSLVGVLCAPLLFSAFDSAFSQHLPYTPAGAWRSVVMSCGVCALVVLAATLLTLRQLGRVRAVELLRDIPTVEERGSGRGRRVLGVINIILVVAFLVAPLFVGGSMTVGRLRSMDEGRFRAVIATMTLQPYSLLPFALALLLLGREILVRVTRGWTALVPSRDPAWRIARMQAVRKVGRLSVTTTLMTLLLSLFFGLLGMAGTSMAAIRPLCAVVPRFASMHSASGSQLLLYFGPALLVAFSGALSGLLIASRGRSRDLALLETCGAAPAQVRAVSAYEGLISMGTSLLVFGGYCLLACLSLAFEFAFLTHRVILAFPWGIFLPVAVIILALGAGTAAVTGVSASRKSVASALGKTVE